MKEFFVVDEKYYLSYLSICFISKQTFKQVSYSIKNKKGPAPNADP